MRYHGDGISWQGGSILSETKIEPAPFEIRETTSHSEEEGGNVKFWVIFTICLSICVISLAAGHWVYLKGMATSSKVKLEELYADSPERVIAVFFTVFLVVQGLCLPFHSASATFFAVMVNDLITATFFLTVFSTLNSIIIWTIGRSCLKKIVDQKISTNPYTRVLAKGIKSHPWKFSFVIRLVYLPSGAKDWILGALQAPAIPAFLSALAIHFVFCLEACVVAEGIKKGVSSTYEEGHSSTWVWIAWIAFVVSICIALGVWAKKEVEREIGVKHSDIGMSRDSTQLEI